MTKNEPARTLRSGFLRSAELRPDRPALSVDGTTLTYAELREQAARIAATLEAAVAREGIAESWPLTAIFGHRDFATFAGILGALF